MYIALDFASTPFNLDHTLNCGQVFRWQKQNQNWYGVVGETIMKVRQLNHGLAFHTFPETQGVDLIRRYFRLDDDLPQIISKINKDATIQRAITTFYGLRITRQDLWECIISYICATFSNIKRIKKMIWNISRRFGKKIVYDGVVFYTFPRVDVLVNATLGELLDCGLGFRAKYVKHAAETVKDSWFNLESMKRLPYLEIKQQLITLPGVGHKVADCILLFSLDRLEAFPIDIWISRILSKYYGQHFLDHKFVKRKEITSKRYEQLSTFGRRYFGEYAGYAQEYLYHYYRLHI